MKPVYVSDASEVSSLRMENDLLTHEVRHLRGRLAAAERKLGKENERRQAAIKDATRLAAANLKTARTALKEANSKVQVARSEARQARAAQRRLMRQVKRYRQAEQDIQWLIGRLNRSPAGPLLRRRSGFRKMLSRYGEKSIAS